MKELVVVENTTPLADSREIAERLGIAHSDFFSNLITKYQDEVEADFGLIRFQNGVKSGPQRGLQPRYALLTEDQSYVYLAYSRNTEKARACKRMLVKAFAEARAGLAVQLPVYFNKQTQDRC
jgi:phage regulator Rha-like protein